MVNPSFQDLETARILKVNDDPYGVSQVLTVSHLSQSLERARTLTPESSWQLPLK